MIDSHNVDSWFFEHWGSNEQKIIGEPCAECGDRAPVQNMNRCADCADTQEVIDALPDDAWTGTLGSPNQNNEFDDGATSRNRIIKTDGFMGPEHKVVGPRDWP